MASLSGIENKFSDTMFLVQRFRFLLASGLFSLYLSVFSTLSFWEIFSAGFSLFTTVVFIHSLGKTIVVRELIVFVATINMVFAPLMVLQIHPEEMIVSSEEYLSYALPATLAFSIGMLVNRSSGINHKSLLESIKPYLLNKEKAVTILLLIGSIGTLLYKRMPVQLTAITYLFSTSLYAAVLYGHYLGGKYRKITLTVAGAVLAYNTVSEGMFGQILYFAALYCCIILISQRKPLSLSIKLGLIAAGVLFVILVQSIKMEYRLKTWGATLSEKRADPTLMWNLVSQRLNDLDFLFGSEHIYATYNRVNQGQLIAEAMYYVPHYEPYANGEIMLHFLYPFIPRFIWDDKPITGGIANIERFTRFVHTVTSSYNISPLGEGYANFGKIGGILFMLFFGVLLNASFHFFIKLATVNPTIICWIPCLYCGCVTLETDVLSVWGSLVTMSVFLFLFWQLTKRMNVQL